MTLPRCQSTDVKYQYRELHEIESALSLMRRFGISQVSPAYRQLYQARGKILALIGFKIPRIVSLLKVLPFLSPGSLKLFHDAESGFMVEARVKPGAPPIYHHVTGEIAISILKDELTHEVEESLMTPDDYIGE